MSKGSTNKLRAIFREKYMLEIYFFLKVNRKIVHSLAYSVHYVAY